LIEVLQRIAPPYPLAQSAVRAAMDVFSAAGLGQSAQRQALIKAERAFLAEKLKACPEILRVYPSEGNFLLVETKDAKAFISKLLRRGILIRSRESDRPGWARLSIGTPQENDLLLAALGVSLSREPRSLRTAGIQRTTRLKIAPWRWARRCEKPSATRRVWRVSGSPRRLMKPLRRSFLIFRGDLLRRLIL
jgi:hypothetical protein